MTATRLLRTLFRLALLVLSVRAGLWAFDQVSAQAGEAMTLAAIVLVLLAYALLLALPFVPGVELGLTVLVMRGAEAAPLVWAATLLGLCIGYALGHWLPPGWLAGALRPLLRRGRYVMLAVLLNLPGNALIGGGGGIAMAAGLSRIFAPLPTLAIFAMATLPVPLTVWLFGPDILPWTY